MTRRIPKTPLSEGDIVQSEVAGRSYPVDVLRDVFVKSGMSPERISRKYFISLDRILDYAECFNWFNLKQDHDRMVLHSALNLRADSFVEHLSADQREQKLKTAQRNQELSEVEEHFDKYGHLFVVNEGGEILRSKVTGLPLKMEFGSSKEEIQMRREIQASTELNLKLLVENQQSPQVLISSAKTETTDVKLLDPIDALANEILNEDE